VYIRDGYGPLLGFLYAWTWFLIAKPASIASVTTGLMRVLGTFQAFAFLSYSAWHWPFEVTYAQLFAMLATIAISGLNHLGIKKAGDFQLFFTLLKVLMILTIVAAGFSYSGGTWANFAGNYAGAKGGIAGFMAALVAALWAYDGWNDLNMVAGEIRNPERDIPIALIAGVVIVGALYVLVNAAVQYVLPASAMGATQQRGCRTDPAATAQMLQSVHGEENPAAAAHPLSGVVHGVQITPIHGDGSRSECTEAQTHAGGSGIDHPHPFRADLLCGQSGRLPGAGQRAGQVHRHDGVGTSADRFGVHRLELPRCRSGRTHRSPPRQSLHQLSRPELHPVEPVPAIDQDVQGNLPDTAALGEAGRKVCG